jgi:hypothetical protein
MLVTWATVALKVAGAVTISLAVWASIRLAAEDEHRHGYEHNIYLNVDDGSIDSRNFRGTLLPTPLNMRSVELGWAQSSAWIP